MMIRKAGTGFIAVVMFGLLLCGAAHGQYHSADTTQDWQINLSELLRVIQFYNSGGYYCSPGSEDDYAPGTSGPRDCAPHDSDYVGGANWQIALSELLRLVQFFNSCGYAVSAATEDGYVPIECGEGEGEGEGSGFTYTELRVQPITAAPGETLLQHIELNAVNTQPGRLEFELFFNANRLSYQAAVGGSMLAVANKDLVITRISDGNYRFLVEDLSKTSLPLQSGILLSIAFTLSAEAGYGDSIIVYGGNASGNSIYGPALDVSVVTGAVTVGCRTPVLPVADFSSDIVTGLAGTTVQFMDASLAGCDPADSAAGPVDAWYWEFGDGEISGEQHPAHVYANTGIYTVSLTVWNGVGSDAVTRAGYIQIVDGAFIYVNKATPAPEELQTGESWDTAFRTIQAGIDAAADLGGGQVWVAANHYDELRGNATGSLVMREVVQLYGGFTGVETERDQRDFVANETIIDGTTADNGEPARHVIIGANNAVLDGFIITGGRARSLSGFPGSEQEGGGMFNGAASPSISNCLFIDNRATTMGGAISNRNTTVPIQISNCLFIENAVYNTGDPSSYAFGGAVANSEAAVVFNGCEFSGNQVQTEAYWLTYSNHVFSRALGGAVYNFGATATFNNCKLNGNLARAQGFGSGQVGGTVYAAKPEALGGAVYNYFSTTVFSQCTVRGNQASTNNNAPFTRADGAGVFNDRGKMLMTNTVVFANTCQDYSTSARGAGIYNDTCNQTRAIVVTNSSIVSNTSDTAATDHGGGMHGKSSAMVVTNTVIWNNSGVDLYGEITAPVVTYCNVEKRIFSGNGNFSATPSFIAMNTGDLRLRSTSPCVDAGRDTSGADFGSVVVDILGVPRGINGNPGYDVDGSDYDIGAYEYTP